MRLLIILALFMLPISLGQFYATDSYALAGKPAANNVLPGETTYNAPVESNTAKSNAASLAESGPDSKNSAMMQAENKLAMVNRVPPKKQKRVNITDGKKNSQGMQLLSVLLMLKEKKQ